MKDALRVVPNALRAAPIALRAAPAAAPISAFMRCASFAKKFGVRVDIVGATPDPDHAGGKYGAPFGLDSVIDWPGRRIYLARHELERPTCAGGLIHELAHTIAAVENPNETDEYAFLGWEWLVAKKTRCQGAWLFTMNDYHVNVVEFDPLDIEEEQLKHMRFTNHTLAFFELSRRDRLRCLQAAVAFGKRHGNIREDDELIAMR